MTTRKDSDRSFWSIVLDYSRNISGISKFVIDGAYHHFPVMSKDQFNAVKRLSKSACVLGNIALTMLAKLNEDGSCFEKDLQRYVASSNFQHHNKE